jgi:hypothetical protein
VRANDYKLGTTLFVLDLESDPVLRGLLAVLVHKLLAVAFGDCQFPRVDVNSSAACVGQFFAVDACSEVALPRRAALEEDAMLVTLSQTDHVPKDGAFVSSLVELLIEQLLAVLPAEVFSGALFKAVSQFLGQHIPV